MARLKLVADGRPENPMELLGGVNTYTLIQRGPVWYVNFRHSGTQYRLSTGTRDRDRAEALVKAVRKFEAPQGHEISRVHLERMMERARFRAKKRGLAFDLGRDAMAALATRCQGRCEVSGHALESEGPFKPSLDRIDCSQGYTPENVRIVCLVANTAMLHYGEAALIELSIAVCRNRRLSEAA